MLSDVTTPQDLDDHLRAALAALGPAGGGPGGAGQTGLGAVVRDGSSLTGEVARQIIEAQFTSRHLDLAARWLASFDAGYHTVASAGHEGNAAVAAAARPTDPALLHYRSTAFYCV